jgi:hypothetical protein
MACLLNMPIVEFVTIVRSGDIAGQVVEKEASRHITQDNAEDWAMYLFGGYAACVAAGITPGGHSPDFNVASRILEEWDPRSFERVKARAVEKMSERVNIAAVALVVERLLEDGEIGFDVVEACVERAKAERI